MSFLESAAVAVVRRTPTTLPSVEQLTLRSVCRTSSLPPSWHMRHLSAIAPTARSRYPAAQARVPRTTTRSCITSTENASKHVREPTFAPKPTRGTSKVFKSADEAVADIKSGSTILSAGFGLCGTAGEKCSRKPKSQLGLIPTSRDIDSSNAGPGARIPEQPYSSVEQRRCVRRRRSLNPHKSWTGHEPDIELSRQQQKFRKEVSPGTYWY